MGSLTRQFMSADTAGMPGGIAMDTLSRMYTLVENFGLENNCWRIVGEQFIYIYIFIMNSGKSAVF